jgi:tRNA (mo5U34)-methyltransferase
MREAAVRSKRLRVGGVEFAVGLDDRYANRIRRTLPYRYVVAPAMRMMRGATAPAPADAAPAPLRLSTRPLDGPKGKLDLSLLNGEARSIGERVNEIDWYHVIDLPCGVSTPGRADHRDQLDLYGLPADMRGMRALDVATFDGFWAFEMERRGAEVVAIDIGRWSQADIPQRLLEKMTPEDDAPTGDGFRLARELLGAHVERRESSVYDLSADDLGTFDVVFMSDLLLHLRDPQRALERLYPLTKKDGVAIIAETINPDLDRLSDMPMTQFVAFSTFIWSVPSASTLKLMSKVAGFEPEEFSRFVLNYDHPFPVNKLVLKAVPWDRLEPVRQGEADVSPVVAVR